MGALAAGLTVGHRIAFDTWWHLAAGRWMVTERAVLRADPFGQSTLGEAWTLPSWAADVLGWLVVDRGGLTVLVILSVLSLGTAVAGVGLLTRGPALVRIGLLVPVAVTVSNRGHTRPEVVTILLTVAVLLLLRAARERPDLRWWFVPIATVWANLHAGFIVGFAIVGIDLVGRALADRRVPWMADRRTIAMLAVAVAGVALLNPYGPRLWRYPFQTVDLEALRVLVLEWQPLLSAPTLTVMCGISALLVLAGAGLARRLPDATGILLLLVFGALALSALRNAALFTIVAAPVAGDLWSVAARRLRPGGAAEHSVDAWIGRVVVVVGVAFFVLRLPSASPAALRTSVQGTAPVAALAASSVDGPLHVGPVFNAYEFGGWLIWSGIAPYVDGRSDLYGDERLLAYLATARAEAGWQETLAEAGVCTLLVKPDAFLRAAALDDGWQEPHVDATAVVLTDPDCPSRSAG